MKNLKPFVFLFSACSFLFTGTVSAQLESCPGNNYCMTQLYGIGCGASFINTVEFVGILNSNSGCTAAPPTDAYCAGYITKVKAGETYTIKLTGDPVFATNFNVWIDFNKNNSFEEEDEWVYSTKDKYSNTLFTGKVTISSKSVIGKTRMRIRSSNSADPLLNPDESCKSVEYGEAEDYILDIEACPAIAEITSLDSLVICPGDSILLSVNEGKAYKWSTGESTQSIYVFAAGNYSCEVTALNDCKAKANVEVLNGECETWIRNVWPAHLKIRVLKSEKRIEIQSMKKGNYTFAFYSLMGSLMRTGNLTNELEYLDLNGLSAGLYLFTIQVDGKNYWKKIDIN